jgi:cell division protein FtsB
MRTPGVLVPASITAGGQGVLGLTFFASANIHIQKYGEILFMVKEKFPAICKWGTVILFFIGILMACGCGEDLKAANEKLKKDVADLTAENDRLKAESTKMRGDLSTLHGQVAELNMQVSSLTDQNQTLQREIDTLREQLRGRRKKP